MEARDRAYRELAAEVVHRAADDYCREVRKTKLVKLEEFFRSDTFRLYTNDKIDPDLLLGRLNEKRDWNMKMKEQIFQRYGGRGGVERFAEEVGSNPVTVRTVLKSAIYPDNVERWEEVLLYGGQGENGMSG